MSDDAPSPNIVSVAPGGPFLVSGTLRLEHASGELIQEGRSFALCRCGASQHKPLCDGAHKEKGFDDPGTVEAPATNAAVDSPATGTLVIRIVPGGPILLNGSFDLVGGEAKMTFRDGKGALCRCGVSQKAPLCDGSHKDCDFDAHTEAAS